MRATFRCFAGCPGSAGAEHPLTRALYTCPSCGGLLAVAHDVDALAATPPERWRALFAERGWAAPGPHASGVWSKREWVAPGVTDDDVVSAVEGRTPLCPAPRLGRELGIADLAIKQSGTSHTGSFKDLGMTVLVSVVKQMIARGQPIRAVACASTGDTSAALAAYGAAAGIPTIVFLPQGKVSAAQLIQPIASGALVLALDTDFDGCMKIVQEVTRDNTIYLANSMNSLRIEGQKTVGIEIVQQFDWAVPDWIIIPVGNLGNISAVGNGLLMMKELGLVDRLPKLVAAQAAKANPLYLSAQNGFREKVVVQAQQTLASAIQIGNPVSYEKAVKTLQAFDGVVEQATEHELADAAARADRTGMYTCPHTGVALAALFKLAARGVIQSHERVVVISTAHGLKFTQFKMGYHEDTLPEVEAVAANPPVYLPPDVKVVKDVIARRIG